MRGGARSGRGFTLLEMLVVLAIAGLLAGIVLPQLQRMAASVESASQRRVILEAIEGMGYRAYRSGKSLVLSNMEAKALWGTDADGGAVSAPEGWRIETPRAILFAANGACSGGDVVLTGPDRRREAYRLQPPRCRAEPVEADE